MKVYRPTDNPISPNGGYTSTHKGYDFAGNNLPDEVRSGKDGEIIERVDEYTTNWRNTGTLTTRDYGNYIKVRHTDGTYALFAHLRKGSSFVKGTKVKAGQVIARIGNTGNSTGPHLHAEYRNANNVNVPVEFYTNTTEQADEETRKRLDNAIYNSGEYDKVCAMLGLPKQDNYGKNASYEVVKEKFDEKDQKIRDREKDITKLTEQITKEKERYTDLLNRFEKDEEEDNEAIRVGIKAQHERDSLRSDLEAITVILGVSKESSREDILDAIQELQKPHDKVADEAVQAYLYKRAEKLFTSFIDWLKYGLQVWRNKKS